MRYYVWSPEMGEEKPEHPEVEAWDHRAAAEQYAADRFYDWEYPKSMSFEVQREDETESYYYEVTVESVPEFYAYRRSGARGGK
jgi:hypothetical protein